MYARYIRTRATSKMSPIMSTEYSALTIDDLIACVWQSHLDATSEDEHIDHRRRILRNAYAASNLSSLGVTLVQVAAYGESVSPDEFVDDDCY